MTSLEDQKISTNKYDLKHQCYDQIYVVTVMYILLLKELLSSKEEVVGTIIGL